MLSTSLIFCERRAKAAFSASVSMSIIESDLWRASESRFSAFSRIAPRTVRITSKIESLRRRNVSSLRSRVMYSSFFSSPGIRAAISCAAVSATLSTAANTPTANSLRMVISTI